MVTMRLPDRCRFAGAVALLVVLGVGCAPKTVTRDIALDVNVAAGSEPGAVVVVGEGRVCEGELSVDVDVDEDGRTFAERLDSALSPTCVQRSEQAELMGKQLPPEVLVGDSVRNLEVARHRERH